MIEYQIVGSQDEEKEKEKETTNWTGGIMILLFTLLIIFSIYVINSDSFSIPILSLSTLHSSSSSSSLDFSLNSSLNEEWISKRIPFIHSEFRSQCTSLMKGDYHSSFSQGYQDWILFMNFFASMNYSGVYLDIGSNHGSQISNSFFFDICLGWKGVCVEPNPVYQETYNIRTCRLIQKCIWKERTTMAFTVDGVSEYVKTKGGLGGGILRQQEKETECITLKDLLIENKDILGEDEGEREHGYGTLVNYVSLDIEGCEADVLYCLDFSIFSDLPQLQLWTIETPHLEEKLTYLDSAMGFGGYIKLHPLLNSDSFLLDDLYMKRRRRKGEEEWILPPQMKCNKEGKKSCSFAELVERGGYPSLIKCS